MGAGSSPRSRCARSTRLDPPEACARNRGVIAYSIRRLLWAFVLVFVITVVTYVLFYVIPTDVRGRFQRTALTP